MYRTAPTWQIIQVLPAFLGTRRVEVVGGIGYIGEDWGSWIQAQVDGATSRISAALTYAGSLPEQVRSGVSAQATWIRSELAQNRDALLSTARAAVSAGYTTAGELVATLGARAGQALASLGQGAGDAFRGFWGISPSGLALAVGAGILLLALGGGALVGLTPGGQAYAGGVARAIGHVGEGTGHALRSAGPALARLAVAG